MKPTVAEIETKSAESGESCQLAVDIGIWAACESERSTVNELVDWLVECRAVVAKARDKHLASNPGDKVALKEYNVRLNTYQEMLNHLMAQVTP
ncbi:hypothetical protein LCGC14_0740990 [marine sediment metagenome]|uniref:Uncharacterized protein n=1 Tax=marine sediment metagenome TaxID=412755 RepID=A0A0F9QAY2_9ZZZZ